jgi:hypothetical protein
MHAVRAGKYVDRFDHAARGDKVIDGCCGFAL